MTVCIFDSEGDPQTLQDFEFPQVTQGGQSKLLTVDIDVGALLQEILIELKKMNLQFNLITDKNHSELSFIV